MDVPVQSHPVSAAMTTALTAPLHIERYDLSTPLPAQIAAWLDQHAPDALFSTSEWFAELAQFQSEATPSPIPRFWLLVFEQGTPLMAAPLEQFKGRAGQTEFALFTNYYSPTIELAVDPTRIARADAWALLLRALDQLAPSWLALKASPLRQLQKEVLEIGIGRRYATFSQEISANHTVDIPDLALYWKSRSSRLNTTLKRKGKALAKADHRFELLQSPSPEQVADYWEIYRHSWKIQEPTPRFVNWLIRWCGQHGHLRMGLLYINGAVVACQLWLMNRQVGHIFKLAQNQAADQYSPGSLLTEFMINTLVAQDGMQRIDFLLGDDSFKPTWMDRREPIFWIEVVNNRRMVGRMLVLYYALRERLRKMKKSEPSVGTEKAAAVETRD